MYSDKLLRYGYHFQRNIDSLVANISEQEVTTFRKSWDRLPIDGYVDRKICHRLRRLSKFKINSS